MRLECRQVHFDIEHPINKFGNLCFRQGLKARNQKIANIFPKKSWIRLTRRLRRWVEKRDGDLVHLDQVKHGSQQRRVHLET